MAATTQALSPAEAQPVAFTAEYLSWGAGYFNDTSCEHMIGRGLYSVGVIVVAPVGILYHLSMAAYGALAQLRMDEGKEKAELSTWSWQHLDAATSDALGWLTAFILPMLIACAVAFSVFAIRGEAVRGIGYLIPFVVLLIQDGATEGILPYAYGKNPLFLRAFLKHSAPEGAKSSQDDLYMMRFAIASLAQNYPLETPLTDAEIYAFRYGPFNDLIKKDHKAFATSLPAHLKRFGRLKEDAPAEEPKKPDSAATQVKAAEVKEEESTDLTKDLVGIKSQIDRWNARLSTLTFPCVIAARVQITPPVGDTINTPYVKNIAFHFVGAEAATMVINALYNMIKTNLEKDREEHANDGKKSIGYIIPQCTAQMTLVHIASKGADKYDVIVHPREVTTKKLGIENRIIHADCTLSEVPDELAVHDLNGIKEKVVEAMQKLHEKG